MTPRKIIVAAASLALAAGGAGAAVASGASAPKKTSVKAVTSLKVKKNRYVIDNLRWDKDVYKVASGGTLHIVQNAPDDGIHTFTVVKEKDLPKTPAALLGSKCKICETLGEAHGADPSSDAPPKFTYLENGVGQNTAPNFDKPGDSGITGDKKGDSFDVKVTAKKGTTLYVMCLIHPWMQAEVKVG